MYNSIVVGYDESESSKAALKEASLWVKKHGGSISLVHAVYFDQEEFAILPSQMEKRFEIGAHACRQAKKSLQDEFGLNGSVESTVCEGEPPEVIVEMAQGKKADLIALGTYGRKGLKRLLMGSVTSQVILNAPCEKALTRACELSRFDGGEITLLYVIPRYEEMMDFFKTDAITKSLFLEAEKIVEGAKKIAAEQGVTIKAVVQEGYAEDTIIAIANTLKDDVIVMGSHGWRGVDKAIMGSTTERVISNATCPILIVR
jgi:nucleotide-binding universal stress UspA family protein